MKAEKSHRWYWVSEQEKTELLIFVQYDSIDKAQARCEWPIASYCVPVTDVLAIKAARMLVFEIRAPPQAPSPAVVSRLDR